MAVPTQFASYLNKLRDNLPDMDFSPETQSVGHDGLADRYLDYYGINFSSQMTGVIHKIGGLPVNGFRIACQLWLPKAGAALIKGTVLVMHGYFDHVGIFGHLIRYLLEKQYAVLVFDLPGHGLSSGKQADIDSFVSYLKVMDEVVKHMDDLPQPLHTVGQSTGCAVLLKSLLTRSKASEQFDKVVLLAPLVRPRGWRSINVSHRLLGRRLKQVKRKFAKKADKSAFLTFIRDSDPLQPRHIPANWIGAMREWGKLFPTLPALGKNLVVVQGDNDRTVDWKYNARVIAEKIPASSLVVIPGAGHHLVNESAELREQIFSAMSL